MSGADLARVNFEGRAAHHQGSDLAANPYPEDDARNAEWTEGWRSGDAEWAPAWMSCWPDDIGL